MPNLDSFIELPLARVVIGADGDARNPLAWPVRVCIHFQPDADGGGAGRGFGRKVVQVKAPVFLYQLALRLFLDPSTSFSYPEQASLGIYMHWYSWNYI